MTTLKDNLRDVIYTKQDLAADELLEEIMDEIKLFFNKHLN